jgi:hypothetical protein
MLLFFLARMCAALSEYYFITPISAFTSLIQLNERRGCVCYAFVPAAHPLQPLLVQCTFLVSSHHSCDFVLIFFRRAGALSEFSCRPC